MQQRLIKESLRFLKPGGGLLFEFGAGQHGQVQGLIRRAGGYARIDLKTDEAGVARVVVAQKAD
jgi:release factor glutamine methyltransferase